MIQIPDDEDEGMDFGEEGYQEKNLDNLLKMFGSKKTSDAIENLSKIRPENWEKLANATQSIIDLAGQLQPNIISQAFSTISDYWEAKFNAMINEWLAPYLPMIFDLINDVAIPFMDGILLGWNEILQGFPSFRAAANRNMRAMNDHLNAMIKEQRMRFLREEFFPQMDILYEGQFENEILEQADLRRGSTTQNISQTREDTRWRKLKEG